MHSSSLDQVTDIPVGIFNINSPNILVTDPCYEKGTWCQGNINNAKTGKWYAQASFSNEKVWDTRVSSLQIFHEGLSFRQLPDMDWKKQKATIGVDSGQAGFFQSERYHENGRGDFDDHDSFYGQICEMTLSSKQAGVIDYGCVSSSGFGDGEYTLETIEDKDKKTVAARIIFISCEDEEEYDEYEE